MAKASDLLNKTGAASLPMQESPAAPTHASGVDAGMAKDESAGAHRPDLGHNLHKGTDKSKGNAGQSGGRPKV